MTRARALAATGCAVVLSAALVGCGSGSTDKSPSSSTSSVDPAVLKYRSDVDALCKAQEAGIKAPAGSLTVASPEAAQKEAFRKIGDGFLALAADLRKVTPPDSIAPDARKWIADFTTAANATGTRGADLLKKGSRPFVQADTDAVALGLVDCVTNNWR